MNTIGKIIITLSVALLLGACTEPNPAYQAGYDQPDSFVETPDSGVPGTDTLPGADTGACIPGNPCDDLDPCTTKDTCNQAGKCVGLQKYTNLPQQVTAPIGVCNPDGAKKSLDGQVTGLEDGVPKHTLVSYEVYQCVTLDYGQVQTIAKVYIRALASMNACSLSNPGCPGPSCVGTSSSLVGAWSQDNATWDNPFKIAIPLSQGGIPRYEHTLKTPLQARYLTLCREADKDVTLDVSVDEVRVEAVYSGATCQS